MKGKEYVINNSCIKLILGDIIESNAEVIVSSDDADISMGGGVSRAIRRNDSSGTIGQDARKNAPADIGDVVVSTAGSLPQKHIFHIITIDYRDLDNKGVLGKVTSDDIHTYIIGHSIDKCFQLMHALDVKSIAFPQIGAGVAGIPIEKVANAMSEAVGRNLRKTNRKFIVEVYLYDRFGRNEIWNFLPMFEQFSAQEAVSRILNEQTFQKLIMENPSETLSEGMFSDTEKDVFISYSRKDSDLVRQIYEFLENNGIKCWIDKDGMYSGVSFKKVIVNAIKRSKIVVFMSSEDSNKSRNVVSEMSVAVEYNKKIIPVRLDASPYSESIEYDILNYDYVVYDRTRQEEANQDILKKIVSTLEMIQAKDV